MHRRSIGRFGNHLFGSARNCGPIRWELEHGRRDYPRPLRKHPYWPRNKPRPNLFYRWIFRLLRDSVGRPRFRLGESPDDGSGWPAHRPWDRAVRPDSGQRDVDRSWALWSLLGRLERQSLLKLLGRGWAGTPFTAEDLFTTRGQLGRRAPLWVMTRPSRDMSSTAGFPPSGRDQAGCGRRTARICMRRCVSARGVAE